MDISRGFGIGGVRRIVLFVRDLLYIGMLWKERCNISNDDDIRYNYKYKGRKWMSIVIFSRIWNVGVS